MPASVWGLSSFVKLLPPDGILCAVFFCCSHCILHAKLTNLVLYLSLSPLNLSPSLSLTLFLWLVHSADNTELNA